MTRSPASPPPDADRRLLDRPDPLPAHAEVAVVGGGLSGLAVARRLARAGVDVVVLEARDDLGAGATARLSGLTLHGTNDHAARLAEAVGEPDARALLRWSARALAAAGELGLRPGALELAWNPAEAADLAAGRALLADVGLAPEPAPEALLAQLPWAELPEGEGAALLAPQGGGLSPRAALATLWAGARAAGAAAVTGATVVGLDSGPALTLADGRRLSCDAVVLCAGWRMRQLDGFFADKVYPVRHQHQRRVGGPPLPCPLSTQGGYLWALPDAAGALVVGGARWATQHLEAGETDDAVVQDQVSAAQDRFVAGRLPPWAACPVVARWSAIATHTCDNLPIVGPLPGRPAVVACTGWNGRPWAWALAAAQAVCDGLLEGRAEGVPARVSPRRFLA